MTYFNYLRIGTIALGIVIVVAAALMLWAALKKRRAGGPVKLAVDISLGAVGVVALAVILIANTLIGTYSGSIDSLMTYTGATASDEDVDSWKELAYEIEEEGIVLMENNDSALPLASGTKVNLLGYIAWNPIYSGGGSGEVSASDSISFVSSLESAGFEINPAIEESGIYDAVAGEDEDTSTSVGFSTSDFVINEVSEDVYTGDVSFESMAAYSDTAIIVVGRTGSEGNDLTVYEDGDYLELSDNEKNLLENARAAFDKVIVIVNSANAMEMGWVDEYDIDAVLWVGLPGPYGLQAVGEVLSGEVNPSGHLTDTWVYDNNSNPVNENFGEQEADNAEGRYYVDYVEGIYVGYKWYETAYAEGAVITNTKTGDTYDYSDYDAVVAYPFGYGLSYTTFEQTIVGGLSDGDELEATGSVSIEVQVTNTGDVAGKDVVELYVTVPYTDYDKENGVEKSEVTLVAYDKTDELQPGESQTLTIEFNVEDVASYDSSCDNGDGTYGAYMLDEGSYIFSIRSDSHNVFDSVTAQLGEQYFFSGENGRSSDEQTAYNQFEEAARGEYLSRQDGFANYESAMNSVSSSIESTDYIDTDNLYDASYDEIDVSYTEGVDYAASGSLTLADMEGLDYDDEQWEELLNQLTLDEMLELTGNVIYSSPAIESIDKTETTDSDGPLGISSMFMTDLITVAFPCVPILASTFNDDIAYEMGSCVADQAEVNGITCWYSPAMDTHRSAYSGRNFEYYSEDGTLAAGMAAAEVSGATDKGLICVIKHFALNDMETNRAYVHTYSNEQAIREIYLRPFESAVKEGHAQAIMNSMNYIGDVYSGAHAGLLTEVTRNEWGFTGFVLTDMDEGGEFRSYWSTIRAGVDVWLGFSAIEITVDSDADIYYLRQASHHILYVMANNRTYGSTILNWRLYRNIIYGELIVLLAACVAAILLRRTKKDKVAVQ